MRLVRQHTAKPFFLFLNNYFAVSPLIWHTTKLAVTVTSAVRLLLCAECHKNTRHKILSCARHTAKRIFTVLLLCHAIFAVRCVR